MGKETETRQIGRRSVRSWAVNYARVMWEEHPEYQKAQARLIGVGLLGLLIYAVVCCALERDWVLLREILLVAGGFVLGVALLSGTAWLVVRIFTRKRTDRSTSHD